MSILSIISNKTKSDRSGTPLRALLLLIEGLALNAIDIDAASRREFQSALRGLGSNLELAADPEQWLLTTSQVIQTLQLFAKKTEEYASEQRRELQRMVDCLATTLVQVSKSSGQTAQGLRAIEQRLMAVTLLDDIREIRAELKLTVSMIQEESTRHERENEVYREEAGHARLRQISMADGTGQLDQATGLPSAREAETAIDSLGGSAGIYPAVFFLERLDLINSRYGFKVGDQMLIRFSQHLAKYMKPGDRLFRWRGPSFVALLSRDTSLDTVRSELKRFSSNKIEHMFDVDNRKVLMRISSDCALISVAADDQKGEVVRRIESFIAAQTARSPAAMERSR